MKRRGFLGAVAAVAAAPLVKRELVITEIDHAARTITLEPQRTLNWIADEMPPREIFGMVRTPRFHAIITNIQDPDDL